MLLRVVIAVFLLLAQASWQTLPALGQPPVFSWPCWMGSELDGISREKGWSTQWPETGLNTVWSSEIGIGFSSVAIQNGRLLTMGYQDGTESVFCLAADTGELLWKHSYPSQLIDNLYEGGPGSTPTIDGDFVYTLGKAGQLFCLKILDGSVVWQQELLQDLEVELPEWGFNSSAFVYRDQVIFEAGRVVAYDKRTGKKAWQTEKHTAGYGSVRAIEVTGKPMLVSLDSDAVRLLDATTGEELDAQSWKSPFRTNSTTPIVHENTVFISTAYQVGCGLFRVQDEKLDLVYSNREMRNHFNNSILFNGYLYGFDGNSNLGRVVHLTCMEHATGNVMWTHRGLGCGSLMIADGKLMILSDDGRLVVAKATPSEYQELATAKILIGRCWTVPVLLNGHVYARNAKGKLVCVQLPRD